VRNRIIHTLPVVLIVIAAFYCTSSTSGEVIKSQDEPQQVTLFSRAAYLTDKNQVTEGQPLTFSIPLEAMMKTGRELRATTTTSCTGISR